MTFVDKVIYNILLYTDYLINYTYLKLRAAAIVNTGSRQLKIIPIISILPILKSRGSYTRTRPKLKRFSWSSRAPACIRSSRAFSIAWLDGGLIALAMKDWQSFTPQDLIFSIVSSNEARISSGTSCSEKCRSWNY